MVDFVFPYVNGEDPVWQSQFTAYCNEHGIKFNEPPRFRDWGLLKYVFRSISLNLPFVRTVHMIVSSDSQVPEWVNRKNVNIVLHKDIIPKEFLPTFNSTAIEMFIHRIPNLSERFLYSNDDIYAVKELQEEQFFRGNRPIVALFLKDTINATSQFRKVVIRCQNLVLKDFNDIVVPTGKYYRPPHLITPMLKSTHKKVWELHKKEIEESISALREEKNYNQYIFTDYQVFSGENVNKNIDGVYCDFFGSTLEKIKKCIEEPEKSILCVNDNSRAPNNVYELLQPSFDMLFPYKCKYEV